ncbi:MAG: hypothetical protein OXH08_07810 [Gammaproteobacteria bacterium]|nr:hypothetical protein [Gammaproteobacteria bacterium]MXW10906.1 hypothetical protein [Gammaproteobacteria bacterium]MYC52283.1 hypothetical protein [Gammaproteobacteria bacterium]
MAASSMPPSTVLADAFESGRRLRRRLPPWVAGGGSEWESRAAPAVIVVSWCAGIMASWEVVSRLS